MQKQHLKALSILRIALTKYNPLKQVLFLRIKIAEIPQ